MKIIVFENDKDFEEFAIDPQVKIVVDGDREYFDWFFTPEYNTEVANGTVFYIKDSKSKIVTRGACTFNIISKPVENVRPYNPIIVELQPKNMEIIDYEKYIQQ